MGSSPLRLNAKLLGPSLLPFGPVLFRIVLGRLPLPLSACFPRAFSHGLRVVAARAFCDGQSTTVSGLAPSVGCPVASRAVCTPRQPQPSLLRRGGGQEAHPCRNSPVSATFQFSSLAVAGFEPSAQKRGHGHQRRDPRGAGALRLHKSRRPGPGAPRRARVWPFLASPRGTLHALLRCADARALVRPGSAPSRIRVARFLGGSCLLSNFGSWPAWDCTKPRWKECLSRRPVTFALVVAKSC